MRAASRRSTDGDRLLPGRRARQRVVVAGGPVAREAVARRRRTARASGRSTVVTSWPPIRSAGTPRRTTPPPSGRRRRTAAGRPRTVSVPGRAGSARGSISPSTQVPAARRLLALAEADRAVRDCRLARALVEDDRLPLAVLAAVRPGRRRAGTGRHVARLALAQRHEQRQVGEAAARNRWKYGTCRSTQNSFRITCPIAIASAPSVPGSPAASGRRTSCARRSRARRRPPSGRGSAPRS